MSQTAGSPIQSSGINPQEIIRIARDVFTRPNYLMGSIKSSTATSQSLIMNILLPISFMMLIIGTINWMSIGAAFFSSFIYSMFISAAYLLVAVLTAKVMASAQVQAFVGSSYTETNALELHATIGVPMLVGQILNVFLPVGLQMLVGLGFLAFVIYLAFLGAKEGLGCQSPVKFIATMILTNIVLVFIIGTIISAIIGTPQITDFSMAAEKFGITEEQAKAMADFQKLAEANQAAQTQ